MKNKLLLFLFLPLPVLCTAQLREFYKTTVNATILLYKKSNGELKAHGTAFILYNYDEKSDETILVTCEHVTHHDTLIAAVPATDSLKKAFVSNKQNTLTFTSGSGGKQTVGFDGNNLLFTIPVELGNNYYKHATLDLATIFCNLPASLINKKNETVAITNMKTLPKSYIGGRDEIFAGEEITFVGFPSGIGTQNGFFGTNMYRDRRSNPLFRKGIVSWTSENEELFLVDGFSYAGNSGSPIFSIPGGGVEGKFLGMVIGHLNDEVELKRQHNDSLQNDVAAAKTYVNINNGLAECIPSYIIYDFASQAGKSRAKMLLQRKEKG
ncbi:MAG: trypsin-like peptidase domain-containing protein [Ferruginibacter sp.]